MSFYSLPKEDRILITEKIGKEIFSDIKTGRKKNILKYFSDEDTYIRKVAYLAIGRIYHATDTFRKSVLLRLDDLFLHEDPKVRQSTINAAGEIAMKDFDVVENLFNDGLFDKHHSVRNAVIGSMKKAGEKNPKPVLAFAKKYLKHPDKEIRREICHGIELRGRTHPQDILPLLKVLQNDKTARVRNTLVHVIGQIAYKKGCLETVIAGLKKWKNQELVSEAIEEIIDVHDRYRNFAILTQEEAKDYIEKHF
ncbi:MAG TPA: HEAT repeat domain-containing protein [Bacteroidia bacterium]|nr:HEAT repeat domain-containing protein [Bacteroidia bacterium]